MIDPSMMPVIALAIVQAIRKAAPSIDGWRVLPVAVIVSAAIAESASWPAFDWRVFVPLFALTFLGALGLDSAIAKYVGKAPRVVIGKVTDPNLEETKPDLLV